MCAHSPSRALEGSVQLTQRLSKASTVFYRYTYRRVNVDQASLKITPLLIPLLSQPVRVGIVSVGWIQDRRDDPVDPHKGIYNTVDIGLAEHVFGSQINFARFLRAQRHLSPDRQESWYSRAARKSAISTHSITQAIRRPPYRCRSAFSAAAAPRTAASRKSRRARATLLPDFHWAARSCSSISTSCAFR